MSSVSSKHSIDLKSKLFRGYSDPARLSILEALRGESLSVSEIVELTGLNQSNVSNHLSCLKECSLVTCEQHGRYVYYRLSDPRINSMLVLAEDLLSDIGNRIYECTRYRS